MATFLVSYKVSRRVAGLAMCGVALALPGCVGIFRWEIPGMVDLAPYEFRQIGLTMLLPREKPNVTDTPTMFYAPMSPMHRYPRSCEEYRAFITIRKVQKNEFERANRLRDPWQRWDASFHPTLDEYKYEGVLILRKDVFCPSGNLVLSISARTYTPRVSAEDIAALRRMVDSVQPLVSGCPGPATSGNPQRR